MSYLSEKSIIPQKNTDHMTHSPQADGVPRQTPFCKACLRFVSELLSLLFIFSPFSLE